MPKNEKNYTRRNLLFRLTKYFLKLNIKETCCDYLKLKYKI